MSSDPIKLIQEIADQEAKAYLSLELGVVTKVFPHADECDKHNYQCTV